MRIHCKKCGNDNLKVRFDYSIGWLTVECKSCNWQRTFVNFETLSAVRAPGVLSRLERLRLKIERKFGAPHRVGEGFG